MMAFAVEDSETLKPSYDPDFLRFYGRLSILKSGDWTEKFYHLKPCTDEEYSKFYDYENKNT